MDANARIASYAGHRDDPGFTATPDDDLRALIATFGLLADLIERLERNTGSPTRALLAAMVVERAHAALEISRLKVARLARRTLVHELPADTLASLRAVAEDPLAFLAGLEPLPQDPRTVPTGRLQFRDPGDCLEGMLHLNHHESRDRFQAAEDLLPGSDEFGNPRGPRYPQLARQLQAGKVRLNATAAAARKLGKLRPGIAARPDADEFARQVESRVAQSLAEGIGRNTTRLFEQVAEELDETSDVPTPEEIRAKTGIFLARRTRHFTYFNACMLNLDAEVFLSHFAESDNPRTNAGNRRAMAEAATLPGAAPIPATPAEPVADPGGGNHTAQDPCTDVPGGQDALFAAPGDGPDWFDRPANAEALDDSPPGSAAATGAVGSAFEGPTPGQRHLQTLLNLMRAPLSPVAKGATGLPSSKLVVYIKLETLLGMARGAGWSAHGLEISVTGLRQRLCEFGFLPMVLGGDGEILDVGREMRFPPAYMKQAVAARDRGCLKPGCTVPPEHCEFHHLEAWAQGGSTSVWNLGMFCTAEHRAVDKGDLRVVMKNGVPWLLLPKFEDPEQIPRRNTVWQGEQPPLL